MRKMDIDPSLAFTALLEMDPAFRNRASDENAEVKAELLRAWHDQDDVLNFWTFARRWIYERRTGVGWQEIIDLRKDAMQVRNSPLALMCTRALEGRLEAWEKCAVVIKTARKVRERPRPTVHVDNRSTNGAFISEALDEASRAHHDGYAVAPVPEDGREHRYGLCPTCSGAA